jgi:hypothetical protein
VPFNQLSVQTVRGAGYRLVPGTRTPAAG